MFPEIRSLPGAVIVLALVLYPYVYMTAQASFLRQPMSQLDVARTLGKSPWGAFLSVALPQARPAIVVGVSLALMECLNDIAAVGFFGVNTLTLGIYTTWLGEGNLGGAAQLAVVLLIFVFALLWVERHARSRNPPCRDHAIPWRRGARRLRAGAGSWPCLPASCRCFWASSCRRSFSCGSRHGMWKISSRRIISTPCGTRWCSPWWQAWWSWSSALSSPMPTVRNAARGSTTFLRLASVGYAMPGTVLGIGVLIPLAYFDNSVDAFMRSAFGVSTGLLLSGTITAIIFAYAIRFLAISFGSLESGLEKVTPNLTFAARTLGRTPLRTVAEIHLPILRPALITATLLVFVDCMKELPATLILRPFDFETLATQVFLLASLGQLEESAAPALTIVAAGLIPIILLTRNLRNRESFR